MTGLRRRRIRNRPCSAQINRIYGVAGRVEPVGGYQSNFGFIID